jgi:hypothetical protein
MQNLQSPFIETNRYLESQVHRLARDRDTYLFFAWFWAMLALLGWGTVIAIAFKAGIIHI